MDTNLTFAKNRLFDTFRTVEAGGKQWLVVNGVPLVEGVLNGRFVPAEEFGSFVNDWNDIPVVLPHPKANGGSARVPAPDVPVVGRFYNAKMDGKRLVGEYWLDKQVLENVEEGQQLMDLISKQKPIETSTGYWSESVPQAGQFNGRDYSYVDQKIHPDHIALLTQEAGACSLADGCGMNRNASAGTYEKRLDDIHTAFMDTMRLREKRASELGSETTVSQDFYVMETTDNFVIAKRGNDLFQVGYTYNPVSGKVYFDDEPEWIPVIQETRYLQKVAQNHGGPGPHKDGSSQDVHGKKGAGSTSTTGKRGFGSTADAWKPQAMPFLKQLEKEPFIFSKEEKKIFDSALDKAYRSRILNESEFGILEEVVEPFKYDDRIAVSVSASSTMEYLKRLRESWQKQNHGGPGPHKDGSSQDVHGGGRGSTSTSTTAKAGKKRKKINATQSAIFRDDGSIEFWSEYGPSGSQMGGANLDVKLGKDAVAKLKLSDRPTNKLQKLDASHSAIFRDDGSIEIWNVYGPSGSQMGGSDLKVKIDKKFFQNVTGSLPADGKKVWESVFEKSKEKYDEERAAQIAWGAVKRAGWEKGKDGSWSKKSTKQNQQDLAGLAVALLFAESIDS